MNKPIWLVKVNHLDIEGKSITSTSEYYFTDFDECIKCYLYYKEHALSSVNIPKEIELNKKWK